MSNKIRSIIIDDENHCIDSLKVLLKKHCPEVTVDESFNTAKEGLLFLKQNPIDLLFLDIEMPWMNGIELLTILGEFNFSVIFTTAHDQYAIQALRLSAIDYLLKPIDPRDLKQAVSRIIQQESRGYVDGIKNLQHNLNPAKSNHRVGIPTRDGIDYILIEDIIYCEADSNYAHLYLIGNKHIIMSKPLKELEKQLASYDFCRIHQSYLININHLVKYIRGNAGYVIMINDAHLNVSRAKKQELLLRIGFESTLS
ncbi:MAG: response regulator transcription factor [Saprospiraceae bacterium]|nr:response regulator transcription factor [Saprospiraceae bacterium]